MKIVYILLGINISIGLYVLVNASKDIKKIKKLLKESKK